MSMSDTARKLMEDEERARIVREASEDTEKFIKSLLKPGYKYEDVWPEDKWEQEMEKHPLFMSEMPENGEVSPLVAAFQSLKYDPEHNDPTELAKAHKEDGNEQFKQEKFQFAVAAYSEGLKMKSEDTHLNTVLYSNRAAAYYHMGKYKKALEDATAAKALTPSHIKAIHRGALSCFEMKNFDDCISWCEDGLKLDDKDETLLNLKEKTKEQIRKQLEAKAEQAVLDGLTTAIKDRGINIAKDGLLTPDSLLYDYNGVSAKIHMKKDEIIWPVVFFYPQYGITDFIPNFNETSCLYAYFNELFSKPPDWDKKKEYTRRTIKKLKAYFCDREGNIVPVNVRHSLRSIMCHKRFEVVGGSVNFYITSQFFDKTFRSENTVADT